MSNKSFFLRRQELIKELTGKIEKETQGINGEETFKFADLASIKKVLDPLKLEYGITDVINFDGFPKNQPSIYLYDLFCTESEEPKLKFFAPIVNAINQESFQSPIQQVGACMTYYRRYLLMLAYDIAADDQIDASQSTEIPEASNVQDLLRLDTVLEQAESNEHNPKHRNILQEQQLDMFQRLDQLVDVQQEESRPLKQDAEVQVSSNLENAVFTSGKWDGQPLKNAIMFGDEGYLRDIASGLYEDIDDNTRNICYQYFHQK